MNLPTLGLSQPSLFAPNQHTPISTSKKTQWASWLPFYPSSTPISNTSAVKQALEFSRGAVQHQNMHPALFYVMARLWIVAALSGAAIVPFSIGIIALVTDLAPCYLGLVLTLFSAVIAYFHFVWCYKYHFHMLTDNLPHIFDNQPPINQLATFHNKQMICAAWIISPYRRELLVQAAHAGIIPQKDLCDALGDIDHHVEQAFDDPTYVSSDILWHPELFQMLSLHLKTNLSTNDQSAAIIPCDHNANRHRETTQQNCDETSEQNHYHPHDGTISPLHFYDLEHSHDFIPLAPSFEFCADAAANIIKSSIPYYPLHPYSNLPIKRQLRTFNRTFISMPQPIPGLGPRVRHIDELAADGSDDNFDAFAEMVLSSILPKYRVAVYYLRSVLFSAISPEDQSDRHLGVMKKLEHLNFIFSGHWSVIAGYVWDEPTQMIHVLVLDSSDEFQHQWLVPLDRLYSACYSKDLDGFRGLVRLELDSVSEITETN